MAPSEPGKPRTQPRLEAATARKAPNWHFSHRNNTTLFIPIGKREREQKRTKKYVMSHHFFVSKLSLNFRRLLPGGCAQERAKPNHQRPVREAEPAQYRRLGDEDVWKGGYYLLGPPGHPEHGAVHRRGFYRQNQARNRRQSAQHRATGCAKRSLWLSFWKARQIMLRLRPPKTAQSKRRNPVYGCLKKGSRFLHWSQGKHGPHQSPQSA